MKILITDKVHSALLAKLKELGHRVDYLTKIKMETLPEIIHNYQGIIINSKIKMHRTILEQTRDLEFIARLGSGMEIVDIPYARSKGIRVINTPEGNCDAVAEHLVGMLLMLAHKLKQGNEQVRSFHWDREGNRGFELMGKTIGIIGVGYTGSATVRRLMGFGMHILGYDKYKKGYAKDFYRIQETDLTTIQAKADIISFHLPLSKETKYLCDQSFLAKCKKGVIIINTSRGNVVKTIDLIKALEEGKVSGACLDVFENEKPHSYSSSEKDIYERLFSHQNVIVSPHVAGWTEESLRRIADLVFSRIVNGYTMEG